MEFFGIKFHYTKGRLRNLTGIDAEDLSGIETSNSDYDDYLRVIECDDCGCLMEFKETTYGYWQCPVCGRKVKQDTFYNQEEKRSGFGIEEPECCKACGGPWPSCESSCKIFDN